MERGRREGKEEEEEEEEEEQVIILDYVTKATKNVTAKKLPLLEEIGKGKFGTVYKTIYEDRICALKRIPYDASIALHDQLIGNVFREAEIMKLYGKHPNLVSILHDYFDDKDNFNIVTEYACHGSLPQWLKSDIGFSSKKKITFCDIVKIIRDAAAGLSYLHSVDTDNNKPMIVHRDIAPRNILVDEIDNEFVGKLGDFGFSKICTDIGASISIGFKAELRRLAPEVMALLEPDEKPLFTTKSDIFAFGICLGEMCCLDWDPWPEYKGTVGTLRLGIFYRKQRQIPDLQIPSNCNSTIKNLIHQCIKFSPKERITAQELFEQLDSLYHELKNQENCSDDGITNPENDSDGITNPEDDRISYVRASKLCEQVLKKQNNEKN